VADLPGRVAELVSTGLWAVATLTLMLDFCGGW